MHHRLLPLIILLFSNTLFGQFSWGLKSGVNIASQKIESAETDRITGFQIMGLAQLKLKNNFSLQAETGYIRKGYQIEVDLSAETSETQIFQLNYLELSTLVRYDIPLGAKFGAYLAAGPSFGYAFSGKMRTENSPLYEGGSMEQDLYLDKLSLVRNDFSAAFGGGLSYQLSQMQLLLDVRYLAGLNNLDRAEQSASRTYNRGFGVSLGALFSISRKR